MEPVRPSEAKIEISSSRVTKISFSQFTAKVKVLELRVLYSAYINMLIAVRLSLSGSLYDLQKRRYDFSAFAKRAWPKNAQNRKISFGIQSYFDQSIIISHLRSFQHSYLKCSKRLFWRPWRLHYQSAVIIWPMTDSSLPILHSNTHLTAYSKALNVWLSNIRGSCIFTPSMCSELIDKIKVHRTCSCFCL